MIKKYTNGSWSEVKYKKCGNKTEEFAEFPVTIRGDGNDLMDYGISGNMSQASGVSPTTPIQPQECGERTGNLLPFTDKLFSVTAGNSNLTVECKNGNLFFQGNAGEISSSQAAWKYNFAFELEAGTYYCNSPVPLGQGFGRYIKKYDDNTTILTSTNYTFTLSEKTKCFLSFYIYQKTLDSQIEVMLNSGNSAVPYEPYGQYKIPISSANTTTPIYLGEVESTRKIGKLVLTGNEIFYRDKEREGSWRFYTTKLVSTKGYTGICSHFENISINDVNNSDNIGFSFFNGAQFGCRCPKSIANTVTDFKSYLAQQYAAGTPVTVWYVLATPTTGIVNEPLRKIGDYADTVSYEQAGVQIPTLHGNTVVDVETELKPSEMTLNWRGWHVADVKEYSDGGWR